MNTGVITSRYAKALLEYTGETGRSAQVCARAEALLRDPDSAVSELDPELQRFVSVVSAHGRMSDIRLMLATFIRMYYESEGILRVTLVCVRESDELASEIKSMLETRTGKKVLLSVSVNPELLGGFVLEAGDYRLDASISRQLEIIRREFIISNNRIV